MATVEELLQHHREEDDKRFDALSATLLKIDVNVESLLDTRSFARGVWKTVVLVATVVSTAIGLFAAWLKH